MTFLRTLKKLVFGETWLLPIGVAAVFAIAVAVRQLAGSEWHQFGGFVLLAGVLAVIVTSVGR